MFTDFETTNSANSPYRPLRLLIAGEGLQSRIGTDWRSTPAGADVAASLMEHKPDILLADAQLIDDKTISALSSPLMQGLPIVLLVGAEDGDQIAPILQHQLYFADRNSSREQLQNILTQAASTLSSGVADAGSLLKQNQLIADLKREADRVAAAIAELAAGSQAETDQTVTASRIRQHIKARRIRDRFFDPSLFADPVWDILLDLAAARLEGRRVSVSSLCIAAQVPTTTALRTIKTLVDRGLLERHDDPSDARRSFIALSATYQQAMDGCLHAMLNLPGQ